VRGTPESRRPWLVLAAMTTALGMLTIDTTVVRVALPTIQRELGTSALAQQWVVNAYLLTLAVFVIAGGRAGDLFGRRRVFLVGLVVFTACSALAGSADGSALLLVARAGQGIGAAIMLPGTLSIVTDAFAGPRLGRAIAVISTVAAAGVSVGPLLGGVLTEFAGWRWIFFVNLPVGIAAFVLTLLVVPEWKKDEAPPLDLRGLALLGAALTALTLGLMQAQDWGWTSPGFAGLLVGAVVAFGLFVARERRSRAPLVDLELLRGSSLVANTVGATAQFAITGLTVLAAIYLQTVLRFSPFDAGLRMLPLTVPALFGSPLTGRLLERISGRTLATAGMVLMAGGMLASGIGADLSDRYVALVPGFLLFGVGFSVVFTVMTTLVMASAKTADRGMASGVYNTARNLGAALGVAVMGGLLAAESGAGTRSDVDGAFALTLEVSAAVLALGALLGWLWLPRGRAEPESAPHP
jgi:EmrB/QacA subfamily drug resistance transporter